MTMTRYLGKQLEGERFILADVFRVQKSADWLDALFLGLQLSRTPWRKGVVKQTFLPPWHSGSRENDRKGLGTKYKTGEHVPSDTLPPIRPHISITFK
ncbi:rCG27930 [Rattus norvegicus]|uniref:RCG27930 n=1 Tax=Rattus norvegicus TaxID=10116 RepID=A6IEK3_RAT|nr:rCG27930 [Rattus norvegicus]